jgi:RND family efflux transporter MFP subunit
LLLAAAGLAAYWMLSGREAAAPAAQPASAARPALTVVLESPQRQDWPRLLAANGNVAAWQEAIIGAEITNYRLSAVEVEVGARVARGQLLARIADEAIAADLAQSTAAVAEAEAAEAEAAANAERARRLRASGFYSEQQAQQAITAGLAASARLAGARARRQADQLRLSQTSIRAPDAGIISARNAAVGLLPQPGQELFRLIRGGRLEWRAELTAAEIAGLAPGLPVAVIAPTGARVAGRLRTIGPTVDAVSRNALVYVDLPASAAESGLRAGSFARGEIELGRTPASSLPQAAVVTRDGHSYVFVHTEGDRVALTRVELGRRLGERVEITAGLDAGARVVASGAGFLADGDTVRVVAAAAR